MSIEGVIQAFEEAEVGSRELDAAFYAAIGRTDLFVDHKPSEYLQYDAVPPEWTYVEMHSHAARTYWTFEISRLVDGEEQYITAHAKTAPLACCLAILRAHKAMGETG